MFTVKVTFKVDKSVFGRDFEYHDFNFDDLTTARRFYIDAVWQYMNDNSVAVTANF